MASAVPLIGLYVNGDNIFGSGQLEVDKDKVIYTGVLSTGWMQLDLLFKSVEPYVAQFQVNPLKFPFMESLRYTAI